jgi:hypothetical protein
MLIFYKVLLLCLTSRHSDNIIQGNYMLVSVNKQIKFNINKLN